MAFISQETKKDLAPAIKAALKKYGMKGSIAIEHHSALVVNVRSGPIDFGATRIQVNQHIPAKFQGEAASFFAELVAAMKGERWFDESDIMTDYFHTAYYIRINIGRWDKPYELTA